MYAKKNSDLRSAMNTAGTPKQATTSTKFSRRGLLAVFGVRLLADATLSRFAIHARATGTAVQEPTMILVAGDAH